MGWEFGVNVVVQLLSPVRLFATPWTVAHQAPPSMGFPRQEYWSGLPFLSPGDLPKLGIKPTSPAWQVDSLPLSHMRSPIGVNRCKLTCRNGWTTGFYYTAQETIFNILG